MFTYSPFSVVELQKFGGSLFFGWDPLLREGGEGGEPAVCNTSDLNEELGQVIIIVIVIDIIILILNLILIDVLELH